MKLAVVASLAVLAGCAASADSPDSRPSPAPPASDPISNTAPAREGDEAALAPRAPAARQKTGTPPRGTCYVDFIDIGTGLAMLARCKDGSDRALNLLYDGGSNDPSLRTQNRLVYILDKGLGFAPGETIHHLFQSHPHFDHHSELVRANGVIAKYDVKHIWDPAAYNDTAAYQCFIKAVIDKANTTKLVYHPGKPCPDFSKLVCDKMAMPAWKTPKTSIEPFDAPYRAKPTNKPVDIDLGSASFTAKILHADPNTSHPNDASLVLKLELFGVKILLTGDEEAGRRAKPDVAATAKSVEKFLLDSKADLSAHIIQVPHHGSETSSTDPFRDAATIMNRTKPDSFAVISSGPKEYSGTELPDASIVKAWETKLGRDRVLSTKLNDGDAPLCANHMDKIAPMPAMDKTPAGCNSIEFTIEDRARGRKITSVVYWPIGPKVTP
ncbi:MAG TPA: hypothetical protein VGD37_23545 [Kofleriaceae bacterium]|jgi:beta-lactamase superfamily II metal-dependent hydrolase